jgi:type III pantothenate kinase
MAGMKLLVDIGNSRIKWAFVAGRDFVAQGQADREAASGLDPLLASPLVPDEIRVANVAGGDAGMRFAGLLGTRFGRAPVLARSAASGPGVRNGYTDPGQLGIDRWLALCAAVVRYGSPLCVVDAGTATTIDVVAAGGDHQGGLILPGIDLMQSALLRGTGDLARLSAGRPRPADVTAAAGVHLGRDTAAAIRNGALQATASLVQATVTGLPGRQQADGVPLLVLTGGAAAPLAAALLQRAAREGDPHPGFRLEQRPDLVLEGLALEPPAFCPMTSAVPG